MWKLQSADQQIQEMKILNYFEAFAIVLNKALSTERKYLTNKYKVLKHPFS